MQNVCIAKCLVPWALHAVCWACSWIRRHVLVPLCAHCRAPERLEFGVGQPEPAPGPSPCRPATQILAVKPVAARGLRIGRCMLTAVEIRHGARPTAGVAPRRCQGFALQSLRTLPRPVRRRWMPLRVASAASQAGEGTSSGGAAAAPSADGGETIASSAATLVNVAGKRY